MDTDAKSPETNRDLVTFHLAHQTYALPIEAIEQIVEMVTVTPLPQTNHLVQGLINVRGKAVPVVNLRRYLGLPEADAHLDTHIILTQTGAWRVGLVVDQVLDVLSLPGERIVPPSNILPQGLGDVPFLKGLVQSKDGMVLVLDPAHLFGADQGRGLALPAAKDVWAVIRPERLLQGAAAPEEAA